MDRREPLIFIVAGETSGDNLAGRLIGRSEAQDGGPRPLCRRRRSAKRGAGSQEPLSHERSFGDGSRRGVAAFAASRPAHQSDGSGSAAARARCRRHGRFRELLASGLRISSAARAFPIVHYVAPQLWAWRPGRAKKLGRRVNHIMALLPFEASFFAKYDIPSTYVGHPAIETGVDRGDGPAFRARHGLPADATVLCVLPGSRNGEVRRLIPVFGEALLTLKASLPGSSHRHPGGPCRGRNRARNDARLAVPGRVRRDGRALRCLRRFGRRPGQIGHRDARACACRRAHGGRLQGQRRHRLPRPPHGRERRPRLAGEPARRTHGRAGVHPGGVHGAEARRGRGRDPRLGSMCARASCKAFARWPRRSAIQSRRRASAPPKSCSTSSTAERPSETRPTGRAAPAPSPDAPRCSD